MKQNKLRVYRKFLHHSRGILRCNPILSLGLAVPFAVVVATSLQSGAALSLTALVTYLPTLMVAAFVGERVPRWLRFPLYPLVASLFLLPARYLISQLFITATDTIGVYMTLMCVSTMLLADVEYAAEQKSVKEAFFYGLRNWAGFCFAVLMLSAVREILGSGTLWGKPLEWVTVKLPGVLVACGGWVLLGFIAAFGKKIHRWIVALTYKKQTTQQ